MKFCVALHKVLVGRVTPCAPFQGCARPEVSLSPSEGERAGVRGFRSVLSLLVLALATFLMSAVNSSAASPVSDLKSDETILFYPTLAAPAEKGGWDVRIHGCVYELERG